MPSKKDIPVSGEFQPEPESPAILDTPSDDFVVTAEQYPVTIAEAEDPVADDEPIDHGPIIAVHRRVSTSGAGVVVFSFADGTEDTRGGVDEAYTAFLDDPTDFAHKIDGLYK